MKPLSKIIAFTLAFMICFYQFWELQAYDKKEQYLKIMSKKTDEKTADRIIRSCLNQYDKLENKKGRDKWKCVRVSFAIMCNESSCWKRYKNNSIHGVQRKFDTQLDAINYFTDRYYKFWYKGTEWAYFYGTAQKSAPTQYCMSEHSSNSVWHCPNGRKAFNYFYVLFEKNLAKK